jgi:hypothetical protein
VGQRCGGGDRPELGADGTEFAFARCWLTAFLASAVGEEHLEPRQRRSAVLARHTRGEGAAQLQSCSAAPSVRSDGDKLVQTHLGQDSRMDQFAFGKVEIASKDPGHTSRGQ